MATYLALIHDAVDVWADPDLHARGYAAHGEFSAKHGAALVGGAELHADAVTVRTGADGTVSVTDGANAPAEEVLGGFYVVTAPDRDAAVGIARHVPAPDGCVVVREVVDHAGTGERRWAALIHGEEALWTDSEYAARGHAAHDTFMKEYVGVVVGGHELAPSTTTTLVRHTPDGGVTLTDGAFPEAKEVLGGFYAFTADDLDAALVIAGEVPTHDGAIELRPTVTDEER